MRKKIKSILSYSYRRMQEHYLTFRLLVWLEECGFVERLMVTFSNVNKNLKDIEEKEKKSREYFDKHREEILQVTDILEDDKSKKVYQACINQRCGIGRIKKNYFCEKNQYFDQEIIRLQPKEVFIDCGAFIGDTIQQFKNMMKKYKIREYSVVAFEPSDRNYTLVCNYFSEDKRIKIIKKGVSNRDDVIYFSECGPKSKVTNNPTEATEKINITSLDNIPECHQATFIKMDIEGAEIEAINGALGIIQTNKPKLAICIYHSDEDMINIPLLIKSIVPEYKIYVRHHSMGNVETVLYAVN